MYDLIVAPFLGDHLVLRPGSTKGMKIPAHRYIELQQAATAGSEVPPWLRRPVQRLAEAAARWAAHRCSGRREP
ncbi:hypothetical protein ACVWXU_006144 [Streptomyces sp. TE33382]